MRLMIFLLLASVLSLGTAQTTGGTFRAAMTTNLATTDSHLSTTTAVRQAAIYMHETLVTLDENYEVIPQLADSWTISDDRLAFTFTLRPGLRFHDGQELTANDVKASIDRYISASQGGSRFEEVTEVNVIDDLTIEFKLSSSIPLLVNLAMPSPFVSIYPASVIEQYGDSAISADDNIGLGPYRLAEWRPDVHTRLVRFDDYVPDDRFEDFTGFGGHRVAYFDEVLLIPVPEAASRIAGLETGEFDFAEAVPITAHAGLDRHPEVEVAVLAPKWAIVLELNQGEAPMDDVRFRQALIAALNMEDVMRAVTFGQSDYYRLQPSIFFPEQTAWYTDAGSDLYNRQDRELVRELLDAVGYNSEPIVYLANRDFDWMYRAVLAASAQWQEAGINIQIEFMDWPSQIERAQSLEGWHINQTGWSPRFDPTQLFSSFHSSSVGAYNYSNPEMDALLLEVNKGLPQEERFAAWERVQELAWEDVAILRIGDYHELEAVRGDISGYRPFYVTPRFWNAYRD